MVITPLALAVTRQTHIINYVMSTKNANDQGFGNSFDATSNALEVLNRFNALDKVDSSAMLEYLTTELERMIDQNDLNIYDLYYILRSIDLLNSTNEEVNTDIETKIGYFLEGLSQVGGGFSPDNASDMSTMISTYYAIEVKAIIDNEYVVETLHLDWTIARLSSNGGFAGSNVTSETSLIDTYCAISILSNADEMDRIASPEDVVSYLSSFYAGSESSSINQGGYLPYSNADYALLSSTFYCVKALKMLRDDGNTVNLRPSSTINWIKSRQNFQDGGFTDSIDGGDKGSTLAGSKFAVYSLAMLGGNLNDNPWMVEFDYVVLIVLIVIIGIVVIAVFLLYRRRKNLV